MTAEAHFPISHFPREKVNSHADAGRGVEREPSWKAKRALLLFAAAWTALVILTPFTMPPGSVGDLSGSVGEIDNDLGHVNGLARAIYAIGDLNCHTKAERSFELNDNQMAFCARDVGLFIGLAAGMAAVLFLNPRFMWPAVIILAAPLVIDGTVQLLLDYESNNVVRIITGTLGGSAVAIFLGHVADVVLRVR